MNFSFAHHEFKNLSINFLGDTIISKKIIKKFLKSNIDN